MTFHKQLFNHDPDNGVYGDCHRTVIAAILGCHPSDVPHFADADDNHENFHRRVREYLKTQNLFETVFLYDGDVELNTLMDIMGANNPDCWWILGGTSKLGCGHSVLCEGGQFRFDPSRVDSGIVGPMEDGFWHVSVLARMATPPASVT